MSDAKPVNTGPLTAEAVRAAIGAALSAEYEPTGPVLHPRDAPTVQAHDQISREPRVEMQRAIADAYGVPHWMVGVEGARVPLAVRLKRLRRRVWGRLTLARWRAERAAARDDEGWWD